MTKKSVVVILLIAVMAFIIPFAAGAEEKKKEYDYKIVYYLTKDSDLVWDIQAQLEKLYYLDPEVDHFVRGTLDETTWYALLDFCEVNNTKELLYTEEGYQVIQPRLEKFILEESPKPKPTATPAPVVVTPTPAPQPTAFPVYHVGDDGPEIIGSVQEALFKLGYFEGIEGRYVAGRFDEVTEAAIQRFCEIIQVQYVQEDGLTQALYMRIIAEDAPQNPKPEAPSFSLIVYDSTGDEVRQAQNILWDLEYFRNLPEPEWGHYDSVTSEALRRFCEVNNVPMHPNGIDIKIWEKLNSKDALPNPLPLTDITEGQQDEQVEALQERLFVLGYYKNRKRTGICDADMIAAVADFAKANQIIYEKGSISVAVHNAILAESAIPYSEEAVKKGFGEKLSEGLTRQVSFLGLQMPLYLTILLAVIILAVLVFFLVRAFSSDDRKEKKGNVQTLGNIVNSGTTGYSMPPSGGGSGMPQLKLDISYRGFTNSVTVNMDKPLRIGRTENTLPIDPNDSDVSRRHCQIYFRDRSTLLLRDYSTNGTIVNNQPINNCETVLNDRDVIKIGGHQIIVHIV